MGKVDVVLFNVGPVATVTDRLFTSGCQFVQIEQRRVRENASS